MQEETKEPIVTLSDLFNLWKRFKKQIMTSVVCFSLFTSLWTLTSPVQYFSEGKFRDKGSTTAGMSTSFSAALISSKMGSQSEENEATTTMKSRTLLMEVARQLNLNGKISEIKPSFNNWVYLPRIIDNIYTEYRLFFYRPTLFFPDKEAIVTIENITYSHEEPYNGITAHFISEEEFELYDSIKKTTLKGYINAPIATDTYQFTLKKNSNQSICGKKFSIQLTPLEYQANQIANFLNVKADKEDKTLVHMSFKNTDRHMAAKTINTLMSVYLEFKQQELRRIADSQLEYLSLRHKQLNSVLGTMMTEHAKKMSKDLLKIGFPNAQTAIDFLANNQSQYQQRLLTIDLEIKRLEQAKQRGYSFFDNYTPHGDPGIINNILAEIRELNKQSDNLQLTLHQADSTNEEKKEQTIAQYVAELDQIKETANTAKLFLEEIQKEEELPNTLPELLDNSKYLVKSWWSQLQNASALEKNVVKSQFVTYMEQLIRLFDIHTHTLSERLTHHQNPQVEFEGVDLGSARELYIAYNKSLNELEAQSAQHEYILGEMRSPDFEVTSLSTLLNDPVSHEMITQTSHLSLQLKETHKRSAKEQVRIREEIEVKKGFMAMHLKNAAQMIKLRRNLIKEKIHSLQNTTLALLQQQVSLLESHLSDYLVQRIKDLTQEREVLINHQHALNAQMTSLPTKLSEEKIIDQQLRINTGVAEEVSRLIESKNLASNLEVSRSVPVEVASPPIKPNSPKLIFFALFGAFLGFFFHMTYLVTRTMMCGMPVSRDNLTASGFHVSGSLTTNFDHSSNQPLRDQDLETLRQTLAFLPKNQGNSSLFVCEDLGPNYSHTIAKLLAKRGLKVLLLNLSFDQLSDKGLLQYLQQKISNPTIQKGPEYDTITAGGISRFSNELISSKRFEELFNALKNEYDWVIGVSHARSMSAETKDLLPLFDYSVLAMTDQTLQELSTPSSMEKTTFVLL